MRKLLLVLAVSLVCVGCSKGGGKSHLMEGATSSDIQQQPQPTDINFPEIGPKSPTK